MGNSIIVDDITLKSIDNNTIELSALISSTDNLFQSLRLWYRFPKIFEPFVSVSGDPFLAVLLPLAMKKKNSLIIEGPITERLYHQAHQIMDIFASWHENMVPISIKAACLKTNTFNSENTGSFFTGGVDSFYSLLKNLRTYNNESRIQYLIYVNGFDINIDNNKLFETVKRQIESVATSLDLESIIISTNLRNLTDRFVLWGKEQHGAALASIGLGLPKFFKTILIPSSCAYSELYPWGSHPLIDNLWSTESLQFIHDGNEAKRSQKIFWELSKSKVALDHLRVCWKNPGNAYNCGTCGKCIRTKINLKLAGVLEQCKTLNSDLHLDRYQEIMLDSFTERRNLRENLNLEEGIDPGFEERLQGLLNSVDNRRNGITFKLKSFLNRFLFN